MYEAFKVMISTRRLPYIGLQGGGVPAGGTEHAGHAYWQSTITPVSAAPQLYPAPPEPSLYVTPTPRDLPSITRRPFKLLRGAGPKIGGPLDDGFSRVAVVGAPGLAEFYSQVNQDTPMARFDIQRTFEGFRQKEKSFSTGDYDNDIESKKSLASRLSQIGNKMDEGKEEGQDGLVDLMGSGFEITNVEPMDTDYKFKQSESGELLNQFETRQPNNSSPASTSSSVSTIKVSKQKPYSESSSDHDMKDVTFNAIEPTVSQEMIAAMKVAKMKARYY